MPDLLGATNPVPGYDNTSINRNIPISPNNTQVQNVPDPSRVTGADNRTEQQDSGQGGEQVRYDSNFQTFLQQLRQLQNGPQILARLLAGEGTVVFSGMSEGIAEELSQALQMLKMDDEGQLLQQSAGLIDVHIQDFVSAAHKKHHLSKYLLSLILSAGCG